MVFVQLIDNPDLPDYPSPYIDSMTLHGRLLYMSNGKGEVVTAGSDGRVTGYGKPAPKDFRKVIRPGEVPESMSGLADIEVEATGPVSVQKLTKGVNRLSGDLKTPIYSVSKELTDASFIQVPSKSTPSYKVTVTKPGYLYVMKGTGKALDPTGLKWQTCSKALAGSLLSGRYRAHVRKQQQFNLSTEEVSLIAGKIDLKPAP